MVLPPRLNIYTGIWSTYLGLANMDLDKTAVLWIRCRVGSGIVENGAIRI